MSRTPRWNPLAPDVLANPIHAYDKMRQQCPVAKSDAMYTTVFRHKDVLDILLDHHTFSSKASRYVSVPNTMDPPEHTAWREIIEPYFSAERLAAFAPICKRLCETLVAGVDTRAPVEIMGDLAEPFALQMQSAYLGWPTWVRQPLREWVHQKNVATREQDDNALKELASAFDDTIRQLIRERRAMGSEAPDDVTTHLLRETIHGRAIRDEELVSLLRNWTVGELGTMASSIGIISHFLATHPNIQTQLREQPNLIEKANDEILRLHAPLINNRRTPTKPVDLHGTQLQPGERITLLWASANRDETVFEAADEFRLDRDPRLNLLYGAGVHKCPGAPLARLELTTMIAALLAATTQINPVADQPPKPAHYPAGGFSEVVLLLR